MKYLVVPALLLTCLFLNGCAAGAATAGYSLKSSTADELDPKARRSLIDDASDRAFEKCKDYCDKTFVKKEQ